MARPPRNTNPNFVRHVSIRTLNAQFLLTPSKKLNELLGGIIAKYQEIFHIEIFTYAVLSNHIHLLVRAPARNLWKFEQSVNRETAKRVNHLRKRKGVLWGRRYDEQICPETADGLEGFLYVTCNPSSHGVVDSPEQWTGLQALQHIRDGKDRYFPFTNFTAYSRALRKAKTSKVKVRIEDFQTVHALVLSRMPGFEACEQQDYAKMIELLIFNRVEALREARLKTGADFLGIDSVLRQSPLDFPKTSKNFPRPPCFSKSLETKINFRKWFLPWRESYRAASKLLRSGNFEAVFPPDCLPPPLHYSC